ncbi:MAG: HlyC/CorC family transporter, partial [Bacteroidales bacterium]|nr:HlyC/CorC family transporter [Bacteroidales bacterium]
MEGNLVIAVLALIFSAFFSGYEISFLSANKLKIELDRKQGRGYARLMDRFLKAPELVISTLLVGNNVAIVIYGMAAAKILDPVIEKYLTTSVGGILAIETIVATLIVLITAEFLPKALSRLNPNGVFSSLYWMFLLFYWLFYPLTYVTNRFSNKVLKIFGVKAGAHQEDHIFDKSDLMDLSSEVANDDEQDDEPSNDMVIFQNALNFSSVKVRECMIPRTEITAVDVQDSLDELSAMFVEQGYSRIMVYRENIDDIIGYVHSKDLFKEMDGQVQSIAELVRTVTYVSEEMSAQTLLAYFTKNRSSIAVVRDEYGGTSGIVTLEDLIEEIFGDINDELDREEFIDKQISEDEFLFSARLEVEAVNRKYDLELPESDDYETLAGLIMFYDEDIPAEKEVVQVGKYSFTIEKKAKNRIETVSVRVLH